MCLLIYNCSPDKEIIKLVVLGFENQVDILKVVILSSNFSKTWEWFLVLSWFFLALLKLYYCYPEGKGAV